MNKAEFTLQIIIAILALAIGAWPIALLLFFWIAYKKKKTQSDKAQSQKKETEIYKTAAEIEHQLHKDAMEDKP